jgi:iron(III) transport system permease protein
LSLFAVITALILSAPILVIVSFVFISAADVWAHLWSTVLADYVLNSLFLVLGVGLGVLLLGVSSAWLTSCCDFPFRRLVSLLLLMPMAMPAYIIAYTYTGLLDFSGPVQSWIRDITGLRYGQYWFPEVRSVWGAVVMLALVLYPYVYLMARAAFLSQSSSILDASRSLGLTPVRSFIRVALPMARPAIVAGLSLALMETLADYGTVQYFGVSTFTTGIFRTYYGFGDVAAAAQLSAMLLSFVVLLILLEKYSRRRIGYFSGADRRAAPSRIKLTPLWGWFSLLACLIPIVFGFLIPILVLVNWAIHSNEWGNGEFASIAWNSFSLATMAASVSVLIALILAYAARLQKNKMTQASVQLTSLGYALPGTIIAIGVIISLAWIDHTIVPIIESLFSIDLGLLFSGTLFALVFAYTIRFLAVSMGSIQSGLQAIKPSIDASARTLGRSSLQILKEIHVPIMKGSVLTAFLIVFVDVLKELPGTLILRPFNFNTLAVRAYELASDERLMDAAPASLMIVMVGLIPVFLLNRSITKN